MCRVPSLYRSPARLLLFRISAFQLTTPSFFFGVFAIRRVYFHRCAVLLYTRLNGFVGRKGPSISEW
jgi:hypothetical protein